ncbi:MAG: hypothetical protein MK033_08585 [Candidatus Caenarcaniphilales bacterium]|nr:hypothetical protein [Candidatus Caenarcaniphilales bacterium]
MFLELPKIPGFGNKKTEAAANTQRNNIVNSPLSNNRVDNRSQAVNLAETMAEQAHDPAIRQAANFNPETPMFSPMAIPIESTPQKIQDLVFKKIGFDIKAGVGIPIVTNTSHMNNTDTGENIDQYVIQLPDQAAVNLLTPGIGKRFKNFLESINPFAKKDFNRDTIKELKKKLHTDKIPNLKQKLMDGAIKAQIIVNYDKNKDTYSVDVLGLSKRPEEFLLEDKKARKVINSLKNDIPKLKKRLLKEYESNKLATELINANFIGLEKLTSDIHKKNKEEWIKDLTEINKGNKLVVLRAMRDENEKRLDGPMGPKIDKSNLAYNLLARTNSNEMPEIDTVAIKGKNIDTEATPWACIDPDTKQISHGSSHSFISDHRRGNIFYSPINTLFSSLTELMFDGDHNVSDKVMKEILLENIENVFKFDLNKSLALGPNPGI